MNAPEWVVAQFAVGRIGSVLVNVNPAYRLHELEETLKQADVATLIAGLPFKTSDFVAMVESIVPEVVSSRPGEWASSRLPALKRLIAIGDHPGRGWLSWSDLDGSHAEELARREAGCRPEDVFNIQFTSGTTGLPKGAMLTHRNVLMNAFYIGQRVRFTERGPRVRAGPVLPLLRLRSGDDRLRGLRVGHRRARADVRREGDPGRDRVRAMHGDLRGADHVRLATRLPGLRRSRPVVAPHRDHGRKPVPLCR